MIYRIVPPFCLLFDPFFWQTPANGSALSCDDENFQHAPNEMSSRSIFLIPPELYPP
jgi:hypothetical protein